MAQELHTLDLQGSTGLLLGREHLFKVITAAGARLGLLVAEMELVELSRRLLLDDLGA